MKKDYIFVPVLVLITVALCLLKLTTMIPHIIISVVGVLVLMAYTVLTIKEWKIKPLEIAYRVSYLIALITGIILKVGVYHISLSIIHKITAILFAVILVVLFVIKLILTKKAKQ